jgi:hypothetical protein
MPLKHRLELRSLCELRTGTLRKAETHENCCNQVLVTLLRSLHLACVR